MDQMAHVAREQGKTLVPRNDDLTARAAVDFAAC